MNSGDQQSTQVQTSNGVGNQGSQQTNVSGEYSNSQSPAKTAAEVRDVTSDRQTTPDLRNQEKAQKSNEAAPPVVVEKSRECVRHEATKSPDEGSTDGATPGPSTNTDRVGAGNQSTAAKPSTVAVSSTNQAARRRAPAIPPLPPCFTTLKTFKSIQLLRPHLQQIAAMLNTGTAGSLACQPPSTAGASGSHSNMVSSVTCSSGNEARNATNESRGGTKDASPENSDSVSKSRDSETRLGDHVVLPGRARDTEGSNVLESGKDPPPSTVMDGRLSIGDSRLGKEGLQPAAGDKTVPELVRTLELPSRVTNNGGEAISSSRDSSRVQACSVSSTVTINKESNSSSSARAEGRTVQNSRQQNTATVTSGIRSNNTSYRNSYEYKLLSSRFNSLFLWPSLLSIIPVKSQIRPVFAERHPPPNGGGGENTENSAASKRKTSRPATDPSRRKRPGLAAVRTASSASVSTPGQQMCIVGQGSAIRKEAPARQPDDPSTGSKEVAFAASQLISLQETSRSLSRKNKRKATPVKRQSSQTNSTRGSKRKKFLESSDSSSCSSSSSESDDDSLEIDYSPAKPQCSTRETRPLTRAQGAVVQLTSSILATDNADHDNADEITSRPVVISTDSDNESQPSLQDVQKDTDVRPAPDEETAGQQSSAEITSRPVVISTDSDNESQPPLQDVQADTDVTGVRPAPDEETAGQQSSAAANQSLSRKSKLSKNNFPSSSSKRKNPSPVKNRGARWRAMLSNVDSEESDAID